MYNTAHKTTFSTIVSVLLFFGLFAVLMLIAMQATTEADEGFFPTAEQQESMTDHYLRCPFSKAELDDLTATNSIRSVVKIIDVSCDKQGGKETALVQVLGDTTQEKQVNRQLFETWLLDQGLQRGDRLEIVEQQ